MLLYDEKNIYYENVKKLQSCLPKPPKRMLCINQYPFNIVKSHNHLFIADIIQPPMSIRFSP
jgi:hypothetical protein